MTETDNNREEGVEFGDLDPVLEDVSYPIEKSEFAEQYGDHSIERTSAEPITVAELFEGTGDDTFESPDEVRQSILNLMPRDSVGRAKYSDRGGSTPAETPAAKSEDETESL